MNPASSSNISDLALKTWYTLVHTWLNGTHNGTHTLGITPEPGPWSSTLSGLLFRKTLQDCQAAVEEIFREDRVNELHLRVTPERPFDVPEVLEVHVVPSGEVRMVPDSPTVTNVLFP